MPGSTFDEAAQRASQHRLQGRQVVVVQGLGFVGVAVAAVVASACDAEGKPLYLVIGIDLPNEAGIAKVTRIAQGLSPIRSPDPELDRSIEAAVHVHGNLLATVDERVFGLADVIVVDIPLDVHDPTVGSPDEIEIDLAGFGGAPRAIGRHMQADALVIVETTVPVGACRRVVHPILTEERAKRGILNPVLLAHAPERVMPGPRYMASIRQYWRAFAGIDGPSATRARQFLESIIDTKAYPLAELEDPTATELAKLLENSYRATCIAHMHEWTLLAEDVGIDLFAVVDAVRRRQGTHDNMRYPGFGVGGYCLTKDSLLAQWAARHFFESSAILHMTLQALQTNVRMPQHTLDLLGGLFGGRLEGKTILLCGVSYLPEVPDTRYSPSELALKRLEQAGARVLVHDPHVTRWAERPEIPVAQDLGACGAEADGVILAVPHSAYRCLSAGEWLALLPQHPAIVDAQNILTDATAEALVRAGCRLCGVGKGHWRKRGYHQ